MNRMYLPLVVMLKCMVCLRVGFIIRLIDFDLMLRIYLNRLLSHVSLMSRALRVNWPLIASDWTFSSNLGQQRNRYQLMYLLIVITRWFRRMVLCNISLMIYSRVRYSVMMFESIIVFRLRWRKLVLKVVEDLVVIIQREQLRLHVFRLRRCPRQRDLLLR